MAASSHRRKPVAPKSIWFRYRNTDTLYGVARETANRLAKTLRLTETQVIHAALAHFAQQNLPHHKIDADPLTAEQKETIRKLQPSGRMTVKQTLF